MGNNITDIRAGVIPDVDHLSPDSGNYPYYGKFIHVFPYSLDKNLTMAGAKEVCHIPVKGDNNLDNIDSVCSLGSTADIADLHGAIHLPTKERFNHNYKIVQTCIKEGKPYWSLCGSYQFLTKYVLGGDLEEYLPKQDQGGKISHHKHGKPPTEPAHTVRIKEGSIFAEVAKKLDIDPNQFPVNSTHKQGVRLDKFKQTFDKLSKQNSTLPFYIEPVAVADDGIVEAIEVRAKPNDELLLFGFQGHTEANLVAIGEHKTPETIWDHVCKEVYAKFIQEVQRTKRNKQSIQPSLEALSKFVAENNKMQEINSVRERDISEPFDEAVIPAQFQKAQPVINETAVTQPPTRAAKNRTSKHESSREKTAHKDRKAPLLTAAFTTLLFVLAAVNLPILLLWGTGTVPVLTAVGISFSLITATSIASTALIVEDKNPKWDALSTDKTIDTSKLKGKREEADQHINELLSEVEPNQHVSRLLAKDNSTTLEPILQ